MAKKSGGSRAEDPDHINNEVVEEIARVTDHLAYLKAGMSAEEIAKLVRDR